MKILITNDDGFDQKGIRLLAEWAKTLGEVTVIAPKVEQSAKSHAIELIKHIEIKEMPIIDGVKVYSMESTPADCVRYGILGLKEKFDIVFSGINRGVNLGADIVYSGTIGAIFEAVRLGVPGIAFSSFPDEQDEAAKHLSVAYDYIIKNNLLEQNAIYNVNIPADIRNGVRMTYQGTQYFSDRFAPVSGKEGFFVQEGEPIPDECPEDMDRDTVAILNGYISVTPLLATRTNMQLFEKYKTK